MSHVTAVEYNCDSVADIQESKKDPKIKLISPILVNNDVKKSRKHIYYYLLKDTSKMVEGNFFTACANRSRYGLLTVPEKAGCFSVILIWVFNVLLTPIILVARFFTAYVIPCIAGTVTYLFSFMCRSCLHKILHTDSEFGPNDNSLGAIQTNKKDIEWFRLADINTGSKDVNKQMHLFSS